VSDKCKDRFCSPCGKERSRLIASNLAAALGDRPSRFITLTLKGSDQHLDEIVNRLLKCFARLRRRSAWATTQAGGAYFLEIKWNSERRQWHPHLHILSRGRFIDQRELSHAWHCVTKDSVIVDVRLVRSGRMAAAYVAKYASKGLQGNYTNDPDKLQEAITCLSGRRMVSTFGDWRGLELTAQTEADDWECLGSLQSFLDRARAHDPEAVRILAILNLRQFTICEAKQCEILGASP
jgi:hypothetical protein